MQFKLGKVWQIDRSYKRWIMKIFLLQNICMPYTISIHYLEFSILAILNITVIDLHRGVEWVWSFLKNFQTRGGVTVWSLDDSWSLFSNWITSWNHFLPALSCLTTITTILLQNNQKTENRLKVCPESVYNEKYMKFTNKV